MTFAAPVVGTGQGGCWRQHDGVSARSVACDAQQCHPASGGGPSGPSYRRGRRLRRRRPAPIGGQAGPKGIYHETRADDLVVKAIRELLRRNPGLDRRRSTRSPSPTTQIGDQGLTLGRVPRASSPGCRMGPRLLHRPYVRGRADRRHHHRGLHGLRCLRRRHRRWCRARRPHPMGEGVDPNPRFVGGRSWSGAARPVHGHDRREPARPLPADHQQRTNELAVTGRRRPPRRTPTRIGQDLVPISVRNTNAEVGETGWGLAPRRRADAPGTTLENLAGLDAVPRTAGSPPATRPV